MKFDKLSLFADGLVVPTDANTTTYSKVIDLRKCNLIDGLLKVYAQVVGTVNATGSVTTTLQVSDSATDGSWTSIASFTQDGMILAAAFFPIKGGKRFARLAFAVGGTALGSAIEVKAGLVDEFDCTVLPSVSVCEDLASLGDALANPLVLSASSATIAKGASGTITINGGAVTTIVPASAKHTIAVANGVITITLAADAADGNEVFVDGLGNKVTVAITAGS